MLCAGGTNGQDGHITLLWGVEAILTSVPMRIYVTERCVDALTWKPERKPNFIKSKSQSKAVFTTGHFKHHI